MPLASPSKRANGISPYSLISHLGLIEQAIVEQQATLLIIDPILAFTGGREVDANKTNEVRPVLMQLSVMAERTGCAIVLVRHLNKASGGNSLYRGGGSIGIIGAARSALLVGKDPDDESRRVLAMNKSNLSSPAPSMAFRQVQAFIPDPDQPGKQGFQKLVLGHFHEGQLGDVL